MREEVILRLEKNDRLSIVGKLERNKNETNSSALERWVKDNGGMGRRYQAATILTDPVVQVEYTKRYVIPSLKQTRAEDPIAQSFWDKVRWYMTLRGRKEGNRFASPEAQKEYERMVKDGTWPKPPPLPRTPDPKT